MVIFSSGTPPPTCLKYHPVLLVGHKILVPQMPKLSRSSPSQCKLLHLKYSTFLVILLIQYSYLNSFSILLTSFLWETLLKKPIFRSTVHTLPMPSHGVFFYSGRKLWDWNITWEQGLLVLLVLFGNNFIEICFTYITFSHLKYIIQ